MAGHVLKNLTKYRAYIWKNAWNELRHRYAGTGFGVFWNLIHPALEIVIYTIVVSMLLGGESHRVRLTVGILTWSAFAGTLRRGSNALFQHARELKQLSIPLEVYLAKVTLGFTLILLLYYCLLIPLLAMLGQPMGWALLSLPILLVLVQLLAFALILTLAPLQVLFPDIKEFLQPFLLLWRWTMPIIYPESVVPVGVRDWLYLNPPHAFFRAIQRLVLSLELPETRDGLAMLVWLGVFFGAGLLVHKKLQNDVRDVI